jgi:hypothetical protein
VNQRLTGGTFVYVRSAGPTPPVLLNDIFYGPGRITNRSASLATTSFVGDPLSEDASNFDYLLALGSPHNRRREFTGLGQ